VVVVYLITSVLYTCDTDCPTVSVVVVVAVGVVGVVVVVVVVKMSQLIDSAYL